MARPRKTGVKRTKSGRISRAASSYNENADAIALRQRMFGISEQDARDQKAATYIGRLCLGGRKKTTDGITEAQYEAAQEYLRCYHAFQRAVKSPDALRSGEGISLGIESEGYADWCKDKVERYRKLTDAIKAEQCLHENRGANMFAAIHLILIRDETMPHLIGDLRLALNAIGHHFGIIPKPRKKAA